MLIGRLPLGFLRKKLNDSNTLFLYLTIALVGVAILYFSSSPVQIYTATALMGLGVGATYPVVYNYLGGAFKELSGTVFSIAIFIALCGQFTFNKITGILFDKMHFNYFPAAMAFAIVMMMLLLPVAKSKLKK
jgi:MFS family permease